MLAGLQYGCWIVCIIIEETLHEDVVGLMWLGRETSGGLFCEITGGGVHRRQGICPAQIFGFSRALLWVSYCN